MDDFYATGSDPYKDPTTGVLQNKLGITDQESLDRTEIELVTPEILRLTLQATWGVKNQDFDDFASYIVKCLDKSMTGRAKSERYK